MRKGEVVCINYFPEATAYGLFGCNATQFFYYFIPRRYHPVHISSYNEIVNIIQYGGLHPELFFVFHQCIFGSFPQGIIGKVDNHLTDMRVSQHIVAPDQAPCILIVSIT